MFVVTLFMLCFERHNVIIKKNVSKNKIYLDIKIVIWYITNAPRKRDAQMIFENWAKRQFFVARII